jgi:hypothetical protein
MPAPVYQNMVNLIVGVPIWRCPVIFMDVAMWEHCTFDLRCLGVAKFTTLTPLSLQILCKLSFQIVSLKMSSLPTFALKALNRIFKLYIGELTEYAFHFLIEAVLHIINFIPCWDMNVQNNDMKPLSIMCDVLLLTQPTWLLIWLYYAQNNLYVFHGCHYSFHIKMCMFSACSVPPPSHLTSHQITYICIFLLKLSLGSLPYRNPICSTFEIWCPYSAP